MDKEIREEIEKIKDRLEEILDDEKEKSECMDEYLPPVKRTETQEAIISDLEDAISSLERIYFRKDN